MGNCLPFIHFSTEQDDTTRLNQVERSTRRESATSGSSASDHGAVGSSSSSSGGRRHQRHVHPSSYVNELYVTSTLAGDDTSADERAMDEKRKARVRGLLEQIPIDSYVEGGKGDPECAICMVDFVPNDAIRFLPCMHAYHVKCIDDWLLRSFTCPSCMEPVDSAILSAFTVNASTDLASLACSPAAAGSSS
ncbi:Protein C01G6.4 [Aphelenchoides avenae]|nr:Protein C01G6.4 [Aphelenchus avenae]